LPNKKTVRATLDQLLRESLSTLVSTRADAASLDLEPGLERTRDTRFGDFTSNVAMRLAKALGRPPRDVAAAIVAALPPSDVLAKAEVAGPGFINLSLTEQAFRDETDRLLLQGEAYGRSSIGRGRRVLVEYLSANPTGPLHVGHGRHAAYGASLATILRAVGYDVDEEYYVNDAGRQMDILAISVWLRYAEACGAAIEFPGNAYQGAYVADIAATIRAEHGAALLGQPESVQALAEQPTGNTEQQLDRLIATIKAMLGADDFRIFFDAALDSVLGDIQQDLAEFQVQPQRWYSERSLTESGAVERALAVLRERGMLYERDGACWFRSTDFGDEKDRVVIRENGITTYFASDIAYHLEKCERGYDLLLDVLGADHHGYVARVRAGLAAMGKNPDCLEVRLVQFVVLYRGQEKVQMSTRTGEYVTLRELRAEVGNDAARFFYVSRSNDQHLEFDLNLAKAQSNDNPVYYVQYAHARVASMLRRMQDDGLPVPSPRAAALVSLAEAEEHQLMATLSRYPEIVQLAAEARAPQHIVHYLREVAAAFHSYYNAHRVLVDEATLREARVLLAMAVQIVLRNGLGLLGVSAPAEM
jgi:arginyl-tRNA synthetase